ncbi:MAG: hypothetical protein AAGA15_15740 [Pseudomonadota bacterium]
MCLSTAALAAFLTLVGADNVSSETDRIIVHAETQDAHWVAQTVADEDIWCTMAPQIDRMTRFTQAVAE